MPQFLPARARRRAAVGALLATTAISAVAAVPATAAAPPGMRDVVAVTNAWSGTVSFLDGNTYTNLGSMNIAADKAQRKFRLRLNPINLIGWEIVKSTKGGENWIDDVVMHDDGKTLIVSRGILQDVVAFDIATRAVKWRFETGSNNADHMAVSPDGNQIAVSGSSTGKTYILNPDTGAKLAELAAGSFPHGIDYSADGRRIYTQSIGIIPLPFALNSLKGDRQITVWDATTFQKIRTYKETYGVRPVALMQDESFIYYQRSYHRGFVERNLSTGTVTRSMTTEPTAKGDAMYPNKLPANSMSHGLALNGPETKLCNAATIDDKVQIVGRGSMAVEKTVHDLAKPYWSQTSRDGSKCLVTNSDGDYVAVIDYATGQLVKKVTAGDYPQRERLGYVSDAAIASLDARP